MHLLHAAFLVLSNGAELTFAAPHLLAIYISQNSTNRLCGWLERCLAVEWVPCRRLLIDACTCWSEGFMSVHCLLSASAAAHVAWAASWTDHTQQPLAVSQVARGRSVCVVIVS
jgi:hypothetical protein